MCNNAYGITVNKGFFCFSHCMSTHKISKFKFMSRNGFTCKVYVKVDVVTQIRNFILRNARDNENHTFA